MDICIQYLDVGLRAPRAATALWLKLAHFGSPNKVTSIRGTAWNTLEHILKMFLRRLSPAGEVVQRSQYSSFPSAFMNQLLRAIVPLVLLPAVVAAEPPKVAPSSPRNEVIVEKDIRIPMRDGVKLALDVYRPAQNGVAMPGKFATLLSRTPYNKNLVAVEATWFASRGYAVVVNDVRGRFASE